MIEKKFNFTDAAIKKLVPPEESRDTYKDAKEQNLIVFVSSSGGRVFYLAQSIAGKYPRIKLGKFPALNVAMAREKAAELKYRISKGYNPALEKAKLAGELTFGDFFTGRYMENYAKPNLKSWRGLEPVINKHAKGIFKMKLSTIQKQNITSIFDKITKTGKIHTANRVIQYLSGIFSKAMEWELLEKNPAAGIKTHKEPSRARYLTSEEIEDFFNALATEKNEQLKDLIIISLCTGTRKGNYTAMQWKEINFYDKTWTIPQEKSKNNESYIVPLADEVIEILKRRKINNSTEWVFPNPKSSSGHLKDPKKSWKSFLKRAGIEDFHLHDLRRTLGSWMAHADVNTNIIGKALNHKSPKSTAIYARLSVNPVRTAVNKALNMIETFKDKKTSGIGQPGNVPATIKAG